MTHSQPQGFLAVPPAGKGFGILAFHAWWGLNDTMKTFRTRLAESGFVVFAPDLYHGKVADNTIDAEILGKALEGIRDLLGDLAAAEVRLRRFISTTASISSRVGPVCGEFLILQRNQQFATHTMRGRYCT